MSEDDNSEKNQTSKNKEYHWNKSKKKILSWSKAIDSVLSTR